MGKIKQALSNLARKKEYTRKDIMRIGEAADRELKGKSDTVKPIRRNKEI